MEENVDSIKESIKKEDDSLKKDNVDIDTTKKTSSLTNKDPGDSFKNKISKESPNNLTSDLNKINVNEENSNKVTSDMNNNKVGEGNLTPLKVKPKKELPIEKKSFNEFINDHLLPAIINEFKIRGFEVADINFKNTSRPIAGDKCWVIFFELKDICNFWLSFEKEDISSLKSISLCKSDQKPSVIESFLIDEKRITLKLIISRILQRLNGQKLIGIN